MNKRISAALVAAQADMPLIRKSGTNPRFGYSYAMLEDYVYLVSPVLAKHGLCCTFSVLSVIDLPNREKQHAVRVQLDMVLTHESGEFVSIVCFGEGQDSGDKAVYKAITGARKYGLACLLGLATSDDPERDESVVDEPSLPPPQTKPQAKATTKKASVAHPPLVDGSRSYKDVIEEKQMGAVEFFGFEGISKEDLEVWIGRQRQHWTREDLRLLGEMKERVDDLRKEIRQKRSAA